MIYYRGVNWNQTWRMYVASSIVEAQKFANLFRGTVLPSTAQDTEWIVVIQTDKNESRTLPY